MQNAAKLDLTSFVSERSFRRLRDALLRWVEAPDLTTTAPVHYVSIADSMRHQADAARERFTR